MIHPKGADHLRSTDEKFYVRLALGLLVGYILFFITNGLNMLSQFNAWLGFITAFTIATGSLIASVLSLVKNKELYPMYFVAFLGLSLMLFTFAIYFLPEAGGVPPLIPLFYD